MKKVLFIAAISLTLFASCRESEKNETISNEEMMLQKQDSLEKVRAENKRLDSLQQVESHGHAH
jgi:uncharacterized protein YcfL